MHPQGDGGNHQDRHRPPGIASQDDGRGTEADGRAEQPELGDGPVRRFALCPVLGIGCGGTQQLPGAGPLQYLQRRRAGRAQQQPSAVVAVGPRAGQEVERFGEALQEVGAEQQPGEGQQRPKHGLPQFLAGDAAHASDQFSHGECGGGRQQGL